MLQMRLQGIWKEVISRPSLLISIKLWFLLTNKEILAQSLCPTSTFEVQWMDKSEQAQAECTTPLQINVKQSSTSHCKLRQEFWKKLLLADQVISQIYLDFLWEVLMTFQDTFCLILIHSCLSTFLNAWTKQSGIRRGIKLVKLWL